MTIQHLMKSSEFRINIKGLGRTHLKKLIIIIIDNYNHENGILPMELKVHYQDKQSHIHISILPFSDIIKSDCNHFNLPLILLMLNSHDYVHSNSSTLLYSQFKYFMLYAIPYILKLNASRLSKLKFETQKSLSCCYKSLK